MFPRVTVTVELQCSDTRSFTEILTITLGLRVGAGALSEGLCPQCATPPPRRPTDGLWPIPRTETQRRVASKREVDLRKFCSIEAFGNTAGRHVSLTPAQVFFSFCFSFNKTEKPVAQIKGGLRAFLGGLGVKCVLSSCPQHVGHGQTEQRAV